MTVKSVIYLFFVNTKLYFLSDKFGLVPLINREQLSFFNLALGMGVNITILIIINAILLAALFFLQFLLCNIGLMNTYAYIILSSFIAVSICSFIYIVVFFAISNMKNSINEHSRVYYTLFIYCRKYLFHY